MSLYGASRRYTMGAVRNAQLAPVIFPGWQLRIYMELGANPRYGAVPQSIIGRLQQLGAELVDSPSDRLAPMMWRFTVIITAIFFSVSIFVICFVLSRLKNLIELNKS